MLKVNIFYCCKDHEVYGKCSLSREEQMNFLMKGDELRESRKLLYGFMLDNMDDEHRMLTRNNLVMKVLGKCEHCAGI